jgi:hypothetical protein
MSLIKSIGRVAQKQISKGRPATKAMGNVVTESYGKPSSLQRRAQNGFASYLSKRQRSGYDPFRQGVIEALSCDLAGQDRANMVIKTVSAKGIKAMAQSFQQTRGRVNEIFNRTMRPTAESQMDDIESEFE